MHLKENLYFIFHIVFYHSVSCRIKLTLRVKVRELRIKKVQQMILRLVFEMYIFLTAGLNSQVSDSSH